MLKQEGLYLPMFLLFFLGILSIIFSSYGIENMRENQPLKANLEQKRVIIVHGWKATPKMHWFPWLKSELEKRRFAAAVPQMPEPENPLLKDWVNKLSNIVGIPDQNTYLVGHSLGVITILKYLEALPEKQTIGGAVLIAGFSTPIPDMPRELNNFFTGKIDYKKISSSAKNFMVINSDNDPVVPLYFGELLSDKLDAAFIIMPGAGHIRQDEGFIQFPEALRSVVEISIK